MDWLKALSESYPAPVDSEDFVLSFDLSQRDELKAFYQKYGFVVVKNVVDENQINKTAEEIWSCKDGTLWEPSGVKRDDPLTWDDPNWMKKFGDVKNGFVNGFSEEELYWSWENRQNPNIYKLFTIILNREDLWVKFDRYGLMRPTKNIRLKNTSATDSPKFISRPQWLTEENWLHWDQNPWRQPNFKGVQGLLALSDSTEDSGGFICVPGSHHIMKQWGENNKSSYSGVEFVAISPEDPLTKFAQKITLRKGSFLLWDSRTLHANYANRGSEFRIVQYITYFPALKDEEDENGGDTKKMRAFQVRVWGHHGHYPPPVLTNLGEKLLGARNWKTGVLECEWRRRTYFTPLNILVVVGLVCVASVFVVRWQIKKEQ